MFERMTSDVLLRRMLDRVDDSFDKREGSIIYDALAPFSIELQEAYLALDFILKETFATTADRDWLITRALEFNVYPNPATPSEVEAVFSEPVDVGTRFNADKLNFVVSDVVEQQSNTYKLTCEQVGIQGNQYIGDITPIIPIPTLQSAKITKIIKPAENEEDTEAFRQRYFAALKDKSFGGNGDDYHKRIMEIEGVGGVKTWRSTGGGHVRVVILTSEFKKPESEFIQKIQGLIDPLTSQATGDGIAPVGHTVSVEAVKERPINVEMGLVVKSSNNIEDFKSTIENVIKAYLLERRKEWATQSEKQGVVVRSAFILADVLKIPNIIDVSFIRVNGKGDRCELQPDEVPVIGTLTLSKGE